MPVGDDNPIKKRVNYEFCVRWPCPGPFVIVRLPADSRSPALGSEQTTAGSEATR